MQVIMPITTDTTEYELEVATISFNLIDTIEHDGLYNGAHDIPMDPYDVIDTLEYIDDWSDPKEVQILKDKGWL